MDELNLYDDLDEFQEQQEKKSKELQDVEEKYQQSLKTIEELREENKALKKNIKRIELGFQSLLDTARNEIKRKDKEIERLRKEKDDICFRRKLPHKASNTSGNQQLVHDTTFNNPFKSNSVKNNNESSTTETATIGTNDPSKIDQNIEAKKRHRGRDDDRDHTGNYKRYRGARDESDVYDHSSHKHTNITNKPNDVKKDKESDKDSSYRRDYSRNRSRERKERDNTSSRHSKSSKASESPEHYGRHTESSRSVEREKYKQFDRNRSHHHKNSGKYSKISSKSPTRKNSATCRGDYQREKSYKKTETDIQIDKDLGKQKSNDFKQKEDNKKTISVTVTEIYHKGTDNLLNEKSNMKLPSDNKNNAKNFKIHDKKERTEIGDTENMKIFTINEDLRVTQSNHSEKEFNKESESIKQLETILTLNSSSIPEPSTFTTPRKLALFNELFGQTPSECSTTATSCESANSLLNNIKDILAKSNQIEVISSATTSPGEYTDISSGKPTPTEDTIKFISSGSNTTHFSEDANDKLSTPKRIDSDIDKCFIPTTLNIPQNVKTIACIDLTEIVEDNIENELDFIEIPGLDLCFQSKNKTNLSSEIHEITISEDLNTANAQENFKDKCPATTIHKNSEINDELKTLQVRFTEELVKGLDISLGTDRKPEATFNANFGIESENELETKNCTEKESGKVNEILKKATTTSLSLELFPAKPQDPFKETTTANVESPKPVQLQKQLTNIVDNVTREVVIVNSNNSCRVLSFQNPYNNQKDNQNLKNKISAEDADIVSESSIKPSEEEIWYTFDDLEMKIQNTHRITSEKNQTLLKDENENGETKEAEDESHTNSKVEHETQTKQITVNVAKPTDETNVKAAFIPICSPPENPTGQEDEQNTFNFKSADNTTVNTDNFPATTTPIKETLVDIILESSKQFESTPAAFPVITSEKQQVTVNLFNPVSTSKSSGSNTNIVTENLATTSNIEGNFNEIKIIEKNKQFKPTVIDELSSLETLKDIRNKQHNISTLKKNESSSSPTHKLAAASVETEAIEIKALSNKITDSDLLENSINENPTFSESKKQFKDISSKTKSIVEDNVNEVEIAKRDTKYTPTATDDLSNKTVLEAIQSEETNCFLLIEKYNQILTPIIENQLSSSLLNKLDTTDSAFKANSKESTDADITESKLSLNNNKLCIQEDYKVVQNEELSSSSLLESEGEVFLATEFPIEVITKDATAVEINESAVPQPALSENIINNEDNLCIQEEFKVVQNEENISSTLLKSAAEVSLAPEFAFEVITKEAIAVEITELVLPENSINIKENPSETNANAQETSLKITAKDISKDSGNELPTLETNSSIASDGDGSEMTPKESCNKFQKISNKNATKGSNNEIYIQVPSNFTPNEDNNNESCIKVTGKHRCPEYSLTLTKDANKIIPILESIDTLINLADLGEKEEISSNKKCDTKILYIGQKVSLETYKNKNPTLKSSDSLVIEGGLEVEENTNSHGNYVNESYVKKSTQETIVEPIKSLNAKEKSSTKMGAEAKTESHSVAPLTSHRSNETLNLKSIISEALEANEEENTAITLSFSTQHISNSHKMDETTTDDKEIETPAMKSCDSVRLKVTDLSNETLSLKSNVSGILEANEEENTATIISLNTQHISNSHKMDETTTDSFVLETSLITLTNDKEIETPAMKSCDSVRLEAEKTNSNIKEITKTSSQDCESLTQESCDLVSKENTNCSKNIAHVKETSLKTSSKELTSEQNTHESHTSLLDMAIKYENVADKTISSDLTENTLAKEANEQIFSHANNVTETAKHEIENTTIESLESSSSVTTCEFNKNVAFVVNITEEPQQNEFEETSLRSNTRDSKFNGGESTKEMSNQIAESEVLQYSQVTLQNVHESGNQEATENFLKHNQVDIVSKRFQETLKKQLQEYFANENKNYAKSNTNKKISLKETAIGFKNKNEHKIVMSAKAIEKFVLKTDWGQRTHDLEKQNKQFNSLIAKLSGYSNSTDATEEEKDFENTEEKLLKNKQTATVSNQKINDDLEPQSVESTNKGQEEKNLHDIQKELFKNHQTISTAIITTFGVEATPKKNTTTNENSGQISNNLKKTTPIQTIEIEQKATKDLQAVQTDIVEDPTPKINKALETPTNADDNVAQDLLNMNNSLALAYTKKQTTSGFKTKKETSVKSIEINNQLSNKYKEQLATPVAKSLIQKNHAILDQQYAYTDYTGTSVKFYKYGDTENPKTTSYTDKQALPVGSKITAVLNPTSSRGQKSEENIKNSIESDNIAVNEHPKTFTSAQSLLALMAHQVDEVANHESYIQNQSSIEEAVHKNDKTTKEDTGNGTKENFKSDSKYLNNNSICLVEQTITCETQNEHTPLIGCDRNQIPKDNKASLLPAVLIIDNHSPVKTKYLLTNDSKDSEATLQTCTSNNTCKKLITKEINMEGEIVEVVTIQMSNDSNATSLNKTPSAMENIKKNLPTTEILNVAQCSSNKDQHAAEIVTQSNNSSSQFNVYKAVHNEPVTSIKEYTAEGKVFEKSPLKIYQQNASKVAEEIGCQTPQKLPTSAGELDKIYKTVQEKDNFHTISSKLPETFSTHPALPSISTTSPTPPNFSGIFSKKSSTISSAEDDFIKSKKKSPHFIAKLKEYILPAASVLCNVDNLENATKTNKKLHWELLDNKNEMSEIEDDYDIDTTDDEEPKIKVEPIENASTPPKQSSLQTITSSHKLQKSSPSETDTQTEDESLLNDMKRQAGIHNEFNCKFSKVYKPKQCQHKLPKNVKNRLKAIGMLNADTFKDNDLVIQQPFSIVLPKRPVGRPRILDNCATNMKVQNTLPKKKRGRKPKQLIAANEVQQPPKDIPKSKSNESIEQTKESEAKNDQQKQEQTNKTITTEPKTDQNRAYVLLDSSERNISEINTMENSMKILSTSVKRLEICDETSSSKNSVKQKITFEKEIEDCKYKDANNTSMIYHKQDSSAEDINATVTENPAAKCHKQLENKDNTESLSVKHKILEAGNKIQDPSSSTSGADKLATDKTNLHVEPTIMVSFKKQQEVPSSRRDTPEKRLSNKSDSEPEKMVAEDLSENKRMEKSLKPKTLAKPLKKQKLKSVIKNKLTNFISLEDIGIKVRPLKGHLSSFRIPKIKKDAEETSHNSWKLETYVELVKEGEKEQIKQPTEHGKECNKMKSVIIKVNSQKDMQQSTSQNVFKQQKPSSMNENSQKARKFNNIKPQEKESNAEAAQLNKQQNKEKNECASAYIINFDNKTTISQRKLFNPDAYDEENQKDHEEITYIENSSSEMYHEQCKYLNKTHELNPVKLRRKSLHNPKKTADSSHNTNSDSCETSSSSKCTKPRRKSMNVHRRILDSSCDEDTDIEIYKNLKIAKTVVDLPTNFNEQNEASTSNKKPLRGRKKSMYVEGPALEAAERPALESVKENSTNTRSKVLRRESSYIESSPALETVDLDEKETNTRRNASRIQLMNFESKPPETMQMINTNCSKKSIYIECNATAETFSESKLLPEPQNTVDNLKFAKNINNDCDKEQIIKSFKMSRKSLYVEPKSLIISKEEIVKITDDKSSKLFTHDSVQQYSKNTKNKSLELQTNRDGNQKVENSKTLGKNLNETNDKEDQTTKTIASFKMRRKSMYMKRNSLENEKVVKNKTTEVLEKKVRFTIHKMDSSKQMNLGSDSTNILTKQEPVKSMLKKSTNQQSNLDSQQMDRDSDSEILVCEENKIQRKSTKQQPNTDINNENISLLNNSEDRKESVESSNSGPENKSSQQMDSGIDSSTIIAQQKSVKMRRKSTNQTHGLDSSSLHPNSLDIKDSKSDSQQTATVPDPSNALTQQKSIKIRLKSAIDKNVDKTSLNYEETKMGSVQNKQELDKKTDNNIESSKNMDSKSESFVFAIQETPIKMRKKSTIKRCNVEIVDTSESNKPKHEIQTKTQPMIPNVDDNKEKDPYSSSSDIKSQSPQRKSTQQPQVTDSSSANKKLETAKNPAEHKSPLQEADSDSSIVLTEHTPIKMRRKSTNQRTILDTSSDDDKPLMKELTVITNVPITPLTAAAKPRQRKRRVVKVLSTSMESPANSNNVSQQSSCQPSPFTSPTLYHPIFSTEVSTQSNEFAASMPVTPNQQDDNKFKEIDSKLHEIFQSPQYSMDYKNLPVVDTSNLTNLPTPASNDFKSNVTIYETPDFNAENDRSSINVSQLNDTTISMLNDTTATQNDNKIKHLSMGNTDYRFEKVSDNVINLFISRKRKRKRNN